MGAGKREGGEAGVSGAAAKLWSRGGFTVFEHGGRVVRFKAPYSLERYVDVVQWERGYLVVMAKYSHARRPEEDYIDLVPILRDLYIDPDAFLAPIEQVEVRYD